MNFNGEECIVCHKKFTEDDDIVVCEVCGTPYHRECYKTFNKCINNTLHENNLSFKPTIEHTESIPNDDDDFENLRYDKIIHASKKMLNRLNLNPDEEFNGISLLDFYLYTKSLGSTKQFHKMNSRNKKNGFFNIFTLLIPGYYLANKRMYVESIFILLTNFFLESPILIQRFNQLDNNQFELLVNNPTFQLISSIFTILLVTLRVLVSFKTLPRYFNKCVDHIKNVKKSQSKESYTRTLINLEGGFDRIAIALVILIDYALRLSLYFLISLLYNQYII